MSTATPTIIWTGLKAPLRLSFYRTRLPAGFPSPAEDHLGDTLDLERLLVKRPASTFFARVQGDSLKGIGIFDEDIVVVDRSLEPATGQVVVAILDGELTLKILERRAEGVRLLAANPEYRPIEVSEEQALSFDLPLTAPADGSASPAGSTYGTVPRPGSAAPTPQRLHARR